MYGAVYNGPARALCHRGKLFLWKLYDVVSLLIEALLERVMEYKHPKSPSLERVARPATPARMRFEDRGPVARRGELPGTCTRTLLDHRVTAG